jgi:hypothetical protein
MDLKDRLLAAGYTVYGVAGAAQTPPGHLYNILNRKRFPRRALARDLERACGGVITAAEWMGLDVAIPTVSVLGTDHQSPPSNSPELGQAC